MKKLYIISIISWAFVVYAQVPDDVEISLSGINGTGCTQGSTAYDISTDKKVFTLMFDNFVVDSSESNERYQAKHCNINLRINVPKGWSYGLFGLDVRGYAYLEPQVQGFQASKYRFSSSEPLTTFDELKLSGPQDSNYQRTTEIPLDQISWSPCSTGGNHSLSIQASIGITRASLPEYNRNEVRRNIANLHSSAAGLYGRTRNILGANHSITSAVEKLRDESLKLHQINDRRPIEELQTAFRNITPYMNTIRDEAANNSQYGNDNQVRNSVSKMTDARRELTRLIVGANSNGNGLMTVDTIDGHVKQQYAIAWARCDSNNNGQWIQVNGESCEQACRQRGRTLAISSEGATCASGEVRPKSAHGKINYNLGCWPNCNPWTKMAPSKSVGKFCYVEGQKKDADKTDQTVGCFCSL